MSFDGFPHDSFDRPLFFRPTIRPIPYQSHLFSHLRSRHESETTAFFTTSIRVPFVPSIKAPRIPSIKAPRIPSIKAPAIPHRVIPGTTRYTSSGEDQEKKQTGSAWLNSRDEYSSQGCTTDLLSTEYTMSFPDRPLVVDTDGSKRRSVDDSTTIGTTSAATPVAHVARAAPFPSSLGFRESGIGFSASSGCTGSSYAGASTIATDDQAEDCVMQSTLPSLSIETSAEQEWSLNNIAFQNPHRAISQSSPSYEKAVRRARPNIQHLTPNLRACLMCQLHKRKCDYGYPGQNKDKTKPHSKNLPCTHCRQMEEKQRHNNPSALYCFYPKPCEKANNGCGRCGLLREQQLVSRPRSIWKHVKKKFRMDEQQRWRRTHSQPTDRQRDSDSERNPMLQAM